MIARWRKRASTPRLVVIGLDCASPELVFTEFLDDLPNLRRLMKTAHWGVLQSCVPCITVPAWSCMFTGNDPGQLGLYGFRNRVEYSYNKYTIANSDSVKTPRVWDILGQHGYESLIISVPQTYPVSEINGNLVSGFLTPGQRSVFTFPAILKGEIRKHFPQIDFDIRDFRMIERETLLQQIFDFTAAQYDLFIHLLKTKSWDFAAHVNIGLDRLHHTFWRYHDPGHRAYEPNNPFEASIGQYYQYIDERIGEILTTVPDDIAVMVVSDHGIKRMDGAFCINQWLIDNGWLVLNEYPDQVVQLDEADVNWRETRAWSTGGYYGRIFLNVIDREPDGCIDPKDYERVRGELKSSLQQIRQPNGHLLTANVFMPQELYREVNGIAPDLLVYFGDLHWRTVGGVGYSSYFLDDNDSGQDDANHAMDGMYIWHNPSSQSVGENLSRTIYDVFPTILRHFQVPLPANIVSNGNL